MDLPLFPLHTVLCPGVALPLHVFEERYRVMVGRCIDLGEPFGVVLIRQGREVGPAGARRLVTPEDPTALSYVLAGLVHVELPARQGLLEAMDTEARLRRLDDLLSREIRLLDRA